MRHGVGRIKDVLMFGDSNNYAGLNVDGSASYDPNGLDVIDSQLWEFRSSDLAHQSRAFSIVADSSHPFDLFAAAVPTDAKNGVGGGMAFMKQYKALGALAPGEVLRITDQGVGGTSLSSGASGAFYAVTGCSNVGAQSTGTAAVVTRINTALAQSQSVGLQVFLLTFGANDAIAGVTRATHGSDLTILIAFLRANITGASNVPVIIQPLVPGYNPGGITTFPAISLAQADVAGSISRCAVVDSTSMVGQTATPYHLDGASQRLWGQRAAALALSL